MKTILFALLVPIFLISCSRDLSSANYVDSSTAGVVLEGMIMSKRAVRIKANEGNEPNVGTLAGGALGGVGGNSFGKGTGKGAATIGGVIAGALIGTALQNEFSTQNGFEYIVKVKDDNMSDIEESRRNYSVNNNTIKNKIVGSMQTNTKTKIISVIQAGNDNLGIGQKVYVIYSDDRPRVVAQSAFDM